MSNLKPSVMEYVVFSLIGFILLLSSFLKSVNIASFTQEARQYINMYLPDFLSKWSYGITISVCMLELVVGIIAITGLYRTVINIIFVVLFSLFIYLTGMNAFFFSDYFGSIDSCGCFGELIHLPPKVSFLKSAVLWLTAVVLVLMDLRKNGITQGWAELKSMLHDIRTYILGTLAVLPSWFSFNYLESLDQRWYIAVYVTLCLIVLACAAVMYRFLYLKKISSLYRNPK